MKISVITPSIRKDGLDIVKKALENQTFDKNEFEWLVCSPSPLPKRFTKLNYTWVDDDSEHGFWALSRSYNKLFEAAEGELIVSLQDWIHIEPDGLQKFWENYEKMGPKSIITGCGDQYERLDKWGKPEIKIWSDPRKTEKYGSFYELGNFDDIEFNWCCFPKQAVLDVGGADNILDFLGFGADLYQMADRLNDFGGYKFYIDQTNESFSIRHDRKDYGGQLYWNENHVLLNHKYDIRKKQLIETDNWPVLKNYGEELTKP